MAFNAAFAGGMAEGFWQAQARSQQLALQKAQIEAEQFKLEQEKRDMAAQGAAFGALSDTQQPQQSPQPYATPMPASPPPNASMPAPMPPGTGGGAPQPPGPSFMPAAAQAATGAPQPGPAPAPGPSPGPMMAQPGGYDIATLARRIKQQNPGADNTMLFQAVAKASQLLMPEAKQNLAVMMQMWRQASTEQKLEMQVALKEADIRSREGIAQLRVDMANIASQRREATAQRGQDIREQTTERGQDLAHEDRQTAEQGRDTRAATARAGKADNSEYQTLSIDLRKTKDQITDVIRNNAGFVPEPGSKNRPEYDRLVARRDATFDKMMKARQKNPALPAPSQALKQPETETPAAQPQQTAAAKPYDPKATYHAGDVFEINGKRYRVVKEDPADPSNPDVEEVK